MYKYENITESSYLIPHTHNSFHFDISPSIFPLIKKRFRNIIYKINFVGVVYGIRCTLPKIQTAML